MESKNRRIIILSAIFLLTFSAIYSTENFHIFQNNLIHYTLDDSTLSAHESPDVKSLDNGREIQTTIRLPRTVDVKIMARIHLRPIPKDELSVYDRWDRAGHVRLVRENEPDIEILKFMTAYGGETEWEMDVSHLAILLQGDCTFAGWIDTWVTPAWYIDFTLSYETSDVSNPTWIKPLFYKLSYELDDPGNSGIETTITIPDTINTVQFYYNVSGHCTDGMGADEFVSKYNVVYIDGREVHRFLPWREDCKQFRAINPYTRRWSNGTWSSDYDRTNWCPGDKVDPLLIKLDEYLTPGKHHIKLVIEDVRPRDENGYYGYWRISAYLTGK